ncbi:MAG: hypothetical protein RR717_07585 [Lachnospiraceae bacterium]
MIGIIIAVVIITIPILSFAKAAGYADERLEEFHNAFIFKEDMQHESQEEC